MKRGLNYKKGSGRWIRFVLYPVVLAALTIVIILAVVLPVLLPNRSALSMSFNGRSNGFMYGTNLFEQALAINKDEQSVKISEIKYPTFGDQYGRLEIESVSIDTPVFFGDTGRQLKSGAGTYSVAHIPGQGRPILMGAHSNTFFSGLEGVKIGNRISFKTNYGDYIYEVVLNENAKFDDEKYYDLDSEEEMLILYTCYQSAPYGATEYRTFVHAKYISGPKLVDE